MTIEEYDKLPIGAALKLADNVQLSDFCAENIYTFPWDSKHMFNKYGRNLTYFKTECCEVGNARGEIAVLHDNSFGQATGDYRYLPKKFFEPDKKYLSLGYGMYTETNQLVRILNRNERYSIICFMFTQQCVITDNCYIKSLRERSNAK